MHRIFRFCGSKRAELALELNFIKIAISELDITPPPPPPPQPHHTHTHQLPFAIRFVAVLFGPLVELPSR